MIWWLHEQFTRTMLDLPDMVMGSYVNLLGTLEFSPMVRKKGLGVWSEQTLQARCEEIAGEYPPEIFQRAVRFLYARTRPAHGSGTSSKCQTAMPNCSSGWSNKTGGRLSKKKQRLPEFVVLTDAEIAQMEKVIRETLGIAPPPIDDQPLL